MLMNFIQKWSVLFHIQDVKTHPVKNTYKKVICSMFVIFIKIISVERFSVLLPTVAISAGWQSRLTQNLFRADDTLHVIEPLPAFQFAHAVVVYRTVVLHAAWMLASVAASPAAPYKVTTIADVARFHTLKPL